MSATSIRINERLPLHVQVVEQLKARIETGLWAPGERLPTVRGLADSLDINYNPVRAAYQDLERQGYIVTRQGRGSFVAAQPPRLPASGTENIVDLIDDAIVAAASQVFPVIWSPGQSMPARHCSVLTTPRYRSSLSRVIGPI